MSLPPASRSPPPLQPLILPTGLSLSHSIRYAPSHSFLPCVLLHRHTPAVHCPPPLLPPLRPLAPPPPPHPTPSSPALIPCTSVIMSLPPVSRSPPPLQPFSLPTRLSLFFSFRYVPSPIPPPHIIIAPAPHPYPPNVALPPPRGSPRAHNPPDPPPSPPTRPDICKDQICAGNI